MQVASAQMPMGDLPLNNSGEDHRGCPPNTRGLGPVSPHQVRGRQARGIGTRAWDNEHDAPRPDAGPRATTPADEMRVASAQTPAGNFPLTGSSEDHRGGPLDHRGLGPVSSTGHRNQGAEPANETRGASAQTPAGDFPLTGSSEDHRGGPLRHGGVGGVASALVEARRLRRLWGLSRLAFGRRPARRG